MGEERKRKKRKEEEKGQRGWVGKEREKTRKMKERKKDLETLHELKGPITRSRVKLLQEEMAKSLAFSFGRG